MVNKNIPKEDITPPIQEYIIEDKKGRKHEEYKQETSAQLPPVWIVVKDHLLDQILGDITKGVSRRFHINSFCKYSSFIYEIEPKNIFDALIGEG